MFRFAGWALGFVVLLCGQIVAADDAPNGLWLQNLEFQYIGVVEGSETTTARAVKFRVKTCIWDEDNELVRRQTFLRQSTAVTADQMYVATGERDQPWEPVATDPTGCLTWTQVVEHGWYKPQQYIIFEYGFMRPEEPGSRRNVYGAFNPWSGSQGFAFDTRELDAEDLKPTNTRQPEVLLRNYSIQADGTNYQVDSFLNLQISKRYTLRFNPMVIRYDSIVNGRQDIEPLRDGWYFLNLALVQKYSHQDKGEMQYATAWQKPVEVRGGQIAVPIVFQLEDLTAADSRNHLLFQIFPIDEKLFLQEASSDQFVIKDSGLKSITYAGSFVPGFEGQSPDLLATTDLVADEIIALGEQNRALRAESFASDHDLSIYDQKFRLFSASLAEKTSNDWLMSSGHLTMEDVTTTLPRLLSESNQQAELDVGMRLCGFWVDYFLPQMLERFENENIAAELEIEPLTESLYDRFTQLFENQCRRAYDKKLPFFSFDRKLIVKEVDPLLTRYLGGSSFNFVVNSDFRLRKSQRWEARQEPILFGNVWRWE